MTTHIYRYIAAAGLALAIGMVPVHAASEAPDVAASEGMEQAEHSEKRAPDVAASEGRERAERSENGAPEKRAAQKKPSRFESCKRDARGVSGPERARFMTECLHERL